MAKGREDGTEIQQDMLLRQERGEARCLVKLKNILLNIIVKLKI